MVRGMRKLNTDVYNASSDIVTWAQSKFGFYVDRWYSVKAHKWVLESGPIKLAQYHADILRHCFTPDRDGRLPYDTVVICEPAKSGKSAIAALCAEYCALHVDRNSVVVMASSKRDQAQSIMFRSLSDSVELNPYLPHADAGRYELTFNSSGNTVKAIASNSRGEAGARFSLACFDELWGYVHTDATRLWSEFKTDPTRLHSLKLAVGYAGYEGESELWQQQLDIGLKGTPVPDLAHIVNQDGESACWANGRHFTFWSHVTRQPWQSSAWLDSQREDLTEGEFRRMILCEFASSEDVFIRPSQWDALVVDGYTCPLPGRETSLIIGVDLAVKRDYAAVVSVVPDHDRKTIALGPYRIFKPNPVVDLSAVEDYLVRLNNTFKVVKILVDPYQAQHLIQRLEGRGMRVVEYPQTVGNMTTAGGTFFDLIHQGRLVVYADAHELREHVLNARSKETGRGIRLVKEGTSRKIDAAIALAMACVEAEDYTTYGPPGTVRYA